MLLLRRKSTAARAPALTPVATSAAAPVAAAGPATIESLGQQLREILPTRRLHSVSLCDHEANVLWLSEGALGPDEHGLVVEALGLLNEDHTLQCHEMAVEDGRLALFLPVRAPTGKLVGIAMILADSKSIGDDTLERMAAAPVRAIMLRLAVLLKPGDLAAAASAAPPALPSVELPELDPFDLIPADSGAPPAAKALPQAVPDAADDAISAEEVNDILEFELTPEDTMHNVPALRAAAAGSAVRSSETSSEMLSLEFLDAAPATGAALRRVAPPAAPPSAPAPQAAAPAPAPVIAPAAPVIPVVKAAAPAPAPKIEVTRATPRAPAPRVEAPVAAAAPAPAVTAPPSAAAATTPTPLAPNDPNLLLEILPYAKLRAGGQSRRFQVLARNSPAPRDPAAHDAVVLQRLMSWLAAHRGAWNTQPTTFTVNLSIATLEDERFVQKMVGALNSHGIAAESLGFEITEALCTQRRAQVERFLTQCEKAGSWLVMDDFSFDSQVLPLLRSRAMRLVKIDAKLSSCALKDKLSQALVVATVQAAKVLGIHCAAKKVDSQAALQWLTAIGCDFAQGAALAGIQTLDSLASSPDPTGLTAQLRPA
jgi:EAL domain-containing protein (putative c-di-GMP-specific phosphodiesterase class I)